jgi:hypothetical protein
MATGPEHYKEAEAIMLAVVGEVIPAPQMMYLVATAQVHATLALAAAAGIAGQADGPHYKDSEAWETVASVTKLDQDSSDESTGASDV